MYIEGKDKLGAIAIIPSAVGFASTELGVIFPYKSVIYKHTKRIEQLQRKLSKLDPESDAAKEKMAEMKHVQALLRKHIDWMHNTFMDHSLQHANVLFVEKPVLQDDAGDDLRSAAIMSHLKVVQWDMFCKRIHDKAQQLGKQVFLIHTDFPLASSCMKCGAFNPMQTLPKGLFWECPECGSRFHTDGFAGEMLLRYGIKKYFPEMIPSTVANSHGDGCNNSVSDNANDCDDLPF